MSHDGKYGMVITEFGEISDDEPVFILRAQDRQEKNADQVRVPTSERSRN